MRRRIAAVGVVVGLVAGSASAQDFMWSGAASRMWDEAAANWEGGSLFTSLANVVFGETGAGEVQVAEAGVTPGAVTVSGGAYTFTGGKIGGEGPLTVDGGATVGMGATLDRQPIVIRNGVFRPTVAAGDLLGDPEAPITVEPGGTFDLNVRGGDAGECLATHNKKYRIAGEGATGANGEKLGAIARLDDLPPETYVSRLHTIELTGDAMVRGGPGTDRWDMRPREDGARTGRPQITGGHTLTIGGGQVVLSDTDVDLKGLVVANDAVLALEGGVTEKLAEGIRLQQGVLRFCGASNPFTEKVVADGPSPQIIVAGSSAQFTGPVHVENGSTLKVSDLWSGFDPVHFSGGVFGTGTVNVGTDICTYFAGDFDPGVVLTVSRGFAVFGDVTAVGDGKNRVVEMTGGNFCFAPSTDSVYSGYTISGTGSFVPSRQGVGSSVVTTVEDTTLNGEVGLVVGLGASGQVERMAGDAVLGQGFVAESLNGLVLGTFESAPGDATLTLAAGSSVTMKEGANIILGGWAGEANNCHRLVVDGGTLDAKGVVPYVGYDTRSAEFLVKGGTAKLPGVSLRFHALYNMTPIEVPAEARNPGIGYEVFGMSGGTVELGGSFDTARIYPYVPQIWLGGGTLVSMADWATDYYQYAMFETWGDSRDETRKAFTLDTNGHAVTFRSALQGNADVTITGGGSFVADDGVQGGVTGHWTIENAGVNDLRNAAAFAGGLTLKDGVTATIDIGARTNYVSVAVACNANNDAANNEFTWDNFWEKAGVFPSLFTKDFRKLLTLSPTPFYTAYRQEAEFYVAEADTYTFGATYDDRCDIVVDGTRVAYNGVFNGVGTGQIWLDVGWHHLNVTSIDYEGGAGPQAAGWKEKGMAAGWHKGATESTNADDYQPIDATTMKMRPVSTVRWCRRYTNEQIPDDWASNDTYTFSMVTNSMQGIHDRDWEMNRGSVNSYSGWMYVEPEEAGTWGLAGVYDDRIDLKIDGNQVFVNDQYNMPKENVTTEVSAGWHRFKVTTSDGNGGWSWAGVEGYGAALYVKRRCDAAQVPFDERNIRMSAEPYGFIGGELNMGAGATLVNASDTPCEIAGTVDGTGTIKGRYALTGTWNLAMDDGRTLRSVTWADGVVDLSKGRLHIALTGKRPLKATYDLGAAAGMTGLAGIEGRVTATLDGEPYVDGFKVAVVGDRVVLKNLKPANTAIILR